MRIRNRRTLLIFIFIKSVFLVYYMYFRLAVNENSEISDSESDTDNYTEFLKELDIHRDIINLYYGKRESWNTSNLGTILFKNINAHDFIREKHVKKIYTVLFWDVWEWQKKRHVYNFGAQNNGSINILNYCSVKNCIFTGDNKTISTADAVIIHMQRKKIPKVKKRNLDQRWIFLSDESPINTFSLGKNSNLTWKDMGDVFNWTMTYRSDSDIPVPYGRTVALLHPTMLHKSDTDANLEKLVPYWKEKRVKNRAMVLVSNCKKSRMDFIHGLQNYIEVDVFGRCSDKPENKNKCPGHFKADCMLPASYLFYLVLENSKCHQYITEKIFQHAYSKGAIPVIMGPSIKDCKALLPPNSFLHVDNYKNIQELSEHMSDISRSLENILTYHLWRKHFAILNEHGYFKTRSYHLCRVCEALNYNDEEIKSYSERDLKSFFSIDRLCDLKYDYGKIY